MLLALEAAGPIVTGGPGEIAGVYQAGGMLFLISWQCSDQSEDVIKRRLELIGHWERPDGWETQGSYAFVDGSGGTIVVEADTADTVARGLTKLLPYFDFEVTPIMETGEWRSITHVGIAFRDSVP